MTQDSPTYANLANLQLIEGLYEKWLSDPTSVDSSWKNFFEGMQFASKLPQALPPRRESLDLRSFSLINAYRIYGHLYANCNVIATDPPSFPEELKLENFALSEEDLEKEFPAHGLFEKETAPLKEIVDVLQKTYCQSVGIEYMDLGSVAIEQSVQQSIEPYFPSHLQNEDRIEILKQLDQAEGFETFLHTKYVGQKRFSLEGAETLIPLLHAILDKAGEEGVSEGIISMAHRGRLNVLANIMGKSYSYIFEEFEDYYTPDFSESSGDVSYHLGFSGIYKGKNGKEIQLFMPSNPSHLESNDPVALGAARAIQEQKKQEAKALPILIHGDSAIAGQGIVYEIMTLSKLKGYSNGGTIHIVVNNQIGFTTLPGDSRSSRYCTDIAKAFGSPVLHVSAEDPEGCVAAARLATELRQKFGCDVFIDLMGYRKYGHNESDEPSFTQPLEYQIIRSKKSIRTLYRDHLVSSEVLSLTQAEELEKNFKENLSSLLETVKSEGPSEEKLKPREEGKDLPALFAPVDTAVPLDRLIPLGKALATPPKDFNLHPKILRLLKERVGMMEKDPTEPSIDWGMGEMLTYATLCTGGIHVRLTGQDVRRGTFSHRHSVYVDQLTSARFFPLSHLSEDQAPCDIFNSPLSEYACLGYELGYDVLYPHCLVLWEAQFGDFANGAQIIIDQYLASQEMKWGQSSNLTLLLPHGSEGMGPEHSSARIERFLQMCAEENMIIANCTTPAQLFHFLRRQALREMEKPAILFTPKGTLRHPLCKSPLEAFAKGGFEEVLDDPNAPQSPTRVLFCSGKFYYDLVKEKDEQDLLIRIEQIYPLNTEKLKKILSNYPQLTSAYYVQEEHENMGAWAFLKPHLEEVLQGKVPLSYIGRPLAASPAAGSHALYNLQHETLLKQLKETRNHS
ncbi:MAG: 2-oxoglutarate dehydrogenase E1/E2 component [Chlamydiae bacterium]|nr:2-oxoglutarate dehydrogenase E1/E2 component [Chlamydiota bacterium]